MLYIVYVSKSLWEENHLFTYGLRIAGDLIFFFLWLLYLPNLMSDIYCNEHMVVV